MLHGTSHSALLPIVNQGADINMDDNTIF